MKYELGFIGCGNMGGALVRAAVKNTPPATVAVFDPDAAKTDALAAECGVTVTDAATLVAESRFIILGVKPQVIADTLAGLRDILAKRSDAVLVSMAAGTSIAALHAALGFACPTVRIMPNTPAAVGEGVILYATCGTTAADEADFCACFAGAGFLDSIEESRIDAASALTGCGPAFVYIFAEALADGAVECGIPRDKALAYAARTLRGAARMVEEKGNPGALKDAVCSPGGTTIAGVHALEKNGFRNATMDAVTAAYRRTLELGKK